VASFSPVTVVSVLASPLQYGGRVFLEGSDDLVVGARVAMFITSLIASGVYVMVIWAIYRAMVKNFDMTIRKQSR
jgi:hypothetical protein